MTSALLRHYQAGHGGGCGDEALRRGHPQTASRARLAAAEYYAKVLNWLAEHLPAPAGGGVLPGQTTLGGSQA